MKVWQGEPIETIYIDIRYGLYWARAYFHPDKDMLQYGYAAYPNPIWASGQSVEEALGKLLLGLYQKNKEVLSFEIRLDLAYSPIEVKTENQNG